MDNARIPRNKFNLDEYTTDLLKGTVWEGYCKGSSPEIESLSPFIDMRRLPGRIDTYENEHIVTVYMPGYSKESIKITIVDTKVTVMASPCVSKKGDPGELSYKISIDSEISKATASLKRGILKIVIPRKIPNVVDIKIN